MLILILDLFYYFLNLSLLISLTTLLFWFLDILCFILYFDLFGRFIIYSLIVFTFNQIIFWISELLRSLSNFYRVYEAMRFILLRIVLFGLWIINLVIIELLALVLIILWLFLFLWVIFRLLSLKLIGMLFIFILLFAVGL